MFASCLLLFVQERHSASVLAMPAASGGRRILPDRSLRPSGACLFRGSGGGLRMPLPNDQFSLATSTRLMKMSSGRPCSWLW